MEKNSNFDMMDNSQKRYELSKRIEDIFNKNKFQLISKNIEDNKVALNNALERLEEEGCPIKTDEYFYGLFKSVNTKESLNAVYDKLKEVSLYSYRAINSCNSNLMDILNLMNILATTERDLYDLLDKNELSIIDMSLFVKDVCKNNNIKNEVVEEFFNTTFQRSYTLRDRINAIKNDLNSRVDKVEENVQVAVLRINQKEDDLRTFIQLKSQEYISSCAKIVSDYKKDLGIAIESQRSRLDDISETSKELLSSIIKAHSDFETKLDILKSDFKNEMKEFFQKQLNELDGRINNCICKDNVLENNINNLQIEITLIKKEIELLKKKTIFDSVIYKVFITVIAILALVISFCN